MENAEGRIGRRTYFNSSVSFRTSRARVEGNESTEKSRARPPSTRLDNIVFQSQVQVLLCFATEILLSSLVQLDNMHRCRSGVMNISMHVCCNSLRYSRNRYICPWHRRRDLLYKQSIRSTNEISRALLLLRSSPV